MSFFKKKSEKIIERQLWHITLNLNARIMPLDRGDWFEDPIDELLTKMNIGVVDGGGTLQEATGEIRYCDVEIILDEKSDETFSKLQDVLSKFPIPKGSSLIFDDKKQAIGSVEGLALYLNGTDLAQEVYESCDVNFVVDELSKLLTEDFFFFSHWEGPSETAIYIYGKSFDKMQELIKPFIEEYPLCKQSRLTQIA